jgi:hypothetical protein
MYDAIASRNMMVLKMERVMLNRIESVSRLNLCRRASAGYNCCHQNLIRPCLLKNSRKSYIIYGPSSYLYSLMIISAALSAMPYTSV